MSISLDGTFGSLAEAAKALWCQDPVLSAAIPGERFFEYGFSQSKPRPPYVVYRPSALINQIHIGDNYYYGIAVASLKIYSLTDINVLSKQARILFSNVGHMESLEGETCGCTCIPGPVLELPGGVFTVDHTLRFKITEYRGPSRLRMT